MAYGERLTIESCVHFMKGLKNTANGKLMEVVFRVFALDTVKQNLGFYLVNGAISRVAGAALIETQNYLIKKMADQIDVLLNCLNVPEHAVYTPIAENWGEYYAHPNFGEVTEHMHAKL